MTERARPEFARALHPADDATGGELVGDAIDERRLVECFDGLAIFACRARELGPVDRRTPERMIGYIPIRIVEVDPIGIERRAQRAAGITWCRWDEQPLESGFGQDPRVGDAVERHATAKAEIGQAAIVRRRIR